METTHYDNEPGEGNGVDIDILGLIVDVSEADSIRDCMVNDIPAILCVKNERAYLCWTLSFQYSMVIEYTPCAVTEEEIFRMAEELRLE